MRTELDEQIEDPETEATTAFGMRALDRITAPIRQLERITGRITQPPSALRSMIEQQRRLQEAIRPSWIREMQALHEAIRPRWMRELAAPTFALEVRELGVPRALSPKLFDPFRGAPALRAVIEQQKRRQELFAPSFLRLAPWLHSLQRIAERIGRRDPIDRAVLAVADNQLAEIVAFTLGTLGLELAHVEHVLDLLLEGGYADSPEPIAYLRLAARRRHQKRVLSDRIGFKRGARVDGYDVDAHVDRCDLALSLAWIDFARLTTDEQSFLMLRCQGYELGEIGCELGWDALRVERVRRSLERRHLSLPVRRYGRPRRRS
ncbi:MAG: hypothetical protein K8H88_27040 [Sandaracinaceae bacterium]|nr:hypothetical protein [Sandaracinaceae bacterium]